MSRQDRKSKRRRILYDIEPACSNSLSWGAVQVEEAVYEEGKDRLFSSGLNPDDWSWLGDPQRRKVDNSRATRIGKGTRSSTLNSSIKSDQPSIEDEPQWIHKTQSDRTCWHKRGGQAKLARFKRNFFNRFCSPEQRKQRKCRVYSLKDNEKTSWRSWP
jgi:hypothetical protein